MASRLFGLLLPLLLAGSLAACKAENPQKNKVEDQAMVQQALEERTKVGQGEESAIQPESASEWLIRPGKSAGPITKATTLADLQKIYGKEKVKTADVYVGEGNSMPGAVIFPDDPQRKAEIIWKEGAKTAAIVIIIGQKSLWHTVEGVTLGTRLKELEKLNGGPFTLAGFDWDYSGALLSWGDNGKLRKAFHNPGGLALRLTYPENPPQDVVESVLGDGDFESSHPGMQKLNPYVHYITVILE